MPSPGLLDFVSPEALERVLNESGILLGVCRGWCSVLQNSSLSNTVNGSRVPGCLSGVPATCRTSVMPKPSRVCRCFWCEAGLGASKRSTMPAVTGATVWSKVLCKGLNQFVCPYHHWTYELDGKLRLTPNAPVGRKNTSWKDWNRSEHSLIPVRCERLARLDLRQSWMAAAEPLDEFVKPMAERLSFVDFTRLSHFFTMTASPHRSELENLPGEHHGALSRAGGAPRARPPGSRWSCTT